MKRLVLAGLILFAGHKAFAPVPIGLGLALKCIAIAVTGATGYILHKCGTEYYLCISQVEGEEPFWFVSQGTATTLAKTGCRRCEGPWKDRTEPDLRASINNRFFAEHGVAVYPCGPLGTIPGPAATPVRMTLQQSTNGGRSWANLATLDTDTDETVPFGLLPATGTNGMSKAQLLEYAGCSMLVTNRSGDSALHRVLYEAP